MVFYISQNLCQNADFISVGAGSSGPAMHPLHQISPTARNILLSWSIRRNPLTQRNDKIESQFGAGVAARLETSIEIPFFKEILWDSLTQRNLGKLKPRSLDGSQESRRAKAEPTHLLWVSQGHMGTNWSAVKLTGGKSGEETHCNWKNYISKIK